MWPTAIGIATVAASLGALYLLTLPRYRRVTLYSLAIAFALELAAVLLTMAFPGGGHSLLWLTQVPAFAAIVLFDSDLARCAPCSMPLWIAGGVAQALAFGAFLALAVGPSERPRK